MKAILCMLSGGVDSTGVLHKILSRQDYADHKLFVHHIHIVNRENRARAERSAVENIIKYYQAHQDKYREFEFFTSIFNVTGFEKIRSTRFPYDMDVCAFYAANICAMRKNIEYVAMGRTQTDINEGSEQFILRMNRAQAIFNATLVLEEHSPAYVFLVRNMTKEEVFKSLPEEVQQCVWWCRRPVYKKEQEAEPCKKCPTCLDMAKII